MDVTSVCRNLLVVVFFSIVTAGSFINAQLHVYQKIITAESGQDVNLTCRAPNFKNNLVEWSRADLGHKYVAVFKDKELKDDDQHPLFKNRVDLQDRQMKDGDVSVILSNVTINDTGTYECHVLKDYMELICTIDLRVGPPGQPGGLKEDGETERRSAGLIVGLIIFALLLVGGVVGFFIYRKHKQQQNKDSYQPPAEQQSV